MPKEYETTVAFKKELKQWWKESGLDGMAEEELIQPKEVLLELTDPETMEIFKAKALVCSRPENLPDGDILLVRDYATDKYFYKWAVKILERIEEPEIQITFKRDKQRFSQMKGEVLKSLLEKGKAKEGS